MIDVSPEQDAPRSVDRPETPWGPLAALAVTILACAAPVVIGLLGALINTQGLLTADGDPFPQGPLALSSPTMLTLMILGQLLSLSIIWGAAGWRGGRTAALRLASPQTDWLTAIGYGLLLIVLIGPIELLLYKIADVRLFSDGQWLLDGLLSPWWWAVTIAAVMLAPLWEELTFRGFLLSALAKGRLGFWPAAVVSTGLWTLLHTGYSWPGLTSVFLAGLGLSWIIQRTGSMRAAVVAHGVINASSLAIALLFAPRG
jgi:membrane protease YdiL (CAAX protease family)